MKVLVVDDEFYTRKAVIKMLNEKYGEMLTIDEAENGAKAIEIIEKQIPDAVLTDVRMPEVDGLQLAKYINENNLKCSVIIFSGYADFEYARKAIKYGADDYILKPVKKENLFEVIDKVQEKIDKTINIEVNERILKTRLLEADGVLVESKLNEIIQKNSDTAGFSYCQLLKMGKAPLSYKVFVLFQKDSFSDNDKTELREAFEKGGESLVYTFFNSSYRNELVILCFGMEGKEKFEYKDLPKQYYHIKQIFHSLDERKAVVGASSTYSAAAPLFIAYEEAKKAALTHLVTGWGKVYEFEKIKEFWIRKKYPYNEELRIFKHLLEERKEEPAANNIKKIFQNTKEETMISMNHLEETCIKLTNIINDVWKEIFSNNKEIIDSLSFKQFNFSNFYELQDIENYYYELVKKTCNAAVRKKDYNQTSLVSELQKYIREHYYEDISLEEIATEKYFMNFSYLSRIFKAETGETFSNALLKIRMEKAKQLLMEKDIPITQVASLTGYNNTAYFVKMFKKYYGETPGYYKKNM